MEDIKASEGIGIAASRVEERAMAVTGIQAFAPSLFEANESVLNGGVLLSLPALVSQGLERVFKVLRPLRAGFYGLHHMVLLTGFMALCRIRNAEQLKSHAPGELGKLLGLDRVPEAGYFRTKLRQILAQAKGDELHKELFRQWVGEMPELFFYIDGHVRVYHGSKANLPKRFVSREKLCLSGTTEFWVNDRQGLPLMVITAELNEKLKVAIEETIPEIKREAAKPASTKTPVFTLVFDREAYEPKWFKKLWDDHQVAIISYRKNVQDKWNEESFIGTEIELYNNSVPMQVCERGTALSGYWFREIRKLSENGHQTAIITTHPSLAIEVIASRMFSRWAQENYFKYMSENFELDRMIEYGTQAVDPKRTIPNPEYKQLTYQLKKKREKKARLDARIFKKMGEGQQLTIEEAMKNIAESSDLVEQINGYEEDIRDLLKQRKGKPARISIAEMPEEKRYNKLLTEGKKFKNAMLMIAYRAESALFNIMGEFYKNKEKDGRMLLKEIFTTHADLYPDYKEKTLTVTLHTLSTPRANQVAKQLCEILNQTETVYPYTDLTIIYKTMAA
ncbi:putative transposase [Aquiflexum sp.]|uniref:putative transposase n=1 Tax=Aquiflexum sp. TaxID=1872584 RepID=UPI0035938B16